MEYNQHQHSPSLKLRLKPSWFSRSRSSSSSTASDSSDDDSLHSPALSSSSSQSSWIRPAAFFSKIGRKSRRRSNNTSEFRYDPTSYALNFDDDSAHVDDEFPMRSFSTRLPPSPQHWSQSTEIATCC